MSHSDPPTPTPHNTPAVWITYQLKWFQYVHQLTLPMQANVANF